MDTKIQTPIYFLFSGSFLPNNGMSMIKAIEINKSSADMKADMRAEMMKHATVSAEDEVACSCPYHEQLEKEKAEDSNINVK